MFWQNKKNFDFSSLIFDSRNILAASLKSIDNELRILYGHPFVREELKNRRIQWRFNLERAPGWVDFSREW